MEVERVGVPVAVQNGQRASGQRVAEELPSTSPLLYSLGRALNMPSFNFFDSCSSWSFRLVANPECKKFEEVSG